MAPTIFCEPEEQRVKLVHQNPIGHLNKSTVYRHRRYLRSNYPRSNRCTVRKHHSRQQKKSKREGDVTQEANSEHRETKTETIEFRAFKGIGLDDNSGNSEDSSSTDLSSANSENCRCSPTEEVNISKYTANTKEANKITDLECYVQDRIQNKNTRGLLDIAIRTIQLIQRNKILQVKLVQLQRETQDFIESVMSNPENQNIEFSTERKTA